MKRAILTLSLLALAACGGGEQAAPEPEGTEEAAKEKDTSPEGVAAVADAIAKSPGDSEKILEEHGWTVEEFEQALVDIAADPAKAKAYSKARGS